MWIEGLCSPDVFLRCIEPDLSRMKCADGIERLRVVGFERIERLIGDKRVRVVAVFVQNFARVLRASIWAGTSSRTRR